VYGLSNAPLEWANEVRRRLLHEGFEAHTLDCMCFIYRVSGHVQCILIFHVDDCLAAYGPQFEFKILQDMFEWGSQEFMPNDIKFTGKHVVLVHHGNEPMLKIHQRSYTRSIDVRRIPSARFRENPELTATERTEYRSCTGSGQWLSGASRPDISASVSLLQDGHPTIHQLQRLYKVLEYVRETPDAGIVLRGIPLNPHDTVVVSYGDSSWANAPDHKSQLGLVVALSSRAALKGAAPASIIDWRSCRSKRQVRSTLAAEANAADQSIDHGYYASAFLSECLTGKSPVTHDPCVALFNATDCKSLYDLVVQRNPSCDEKRTLIDVKSIQYSLRNGTIRWIPTHEQMADPLTKLDVGLMRRMTEWMQYPVCQLHD